MLIVLLALAGVIIGPLLGIVVDRAVDREQPELLHRCQVCKSNLDARSVIPVVGWMSRCQTDQTHAWWRYPLVDVTAAATFALAGWRFGSHWMLGPFLAFFAVLVVASIIDIETHLLLNVLTFPTFLVGITAVLLFSMANDQAELVWPAILGAVVFGGAIFGSYLAYPPGMGLGDAKLAPSLGLFLGWVAGSPLLAVQYSLYALLAGLLGTAVLAITLRVLRVLGPRAEVPMGPGLALGTVLVLALS